MWSVLVRTCTILLLIFQWLYLWFPQLYFGSFISRTYIYNWYFHNHLVQLFVLSCKVQKKIWIDNLKNVKYAVPHVSTIVILKRHYVLVASSFTSDHLRRWGRKFYKSYFILTQVKVSIQKKIFVINSPTSRLQWKINL